jgi:hypothetical protein
VASAADTKKSVRIVTFNGSGLKRPQCDNQQANDDRLDDNDRYHHAVAHGG